MAQQACFKKYFNQKETVGFRFNQVNSVGVIADGHIDFEFYRPWLIIAFLPSGSGGGPSNIPIVANAHMVTFAAAYEKFFLYAAQANAVAGTDPTGAIAFSPVVPNDYSFYFEKIINTNLNKFNLIALQYPEAFVEDFWQGMQLAGVQWPECCVQFYELIEFLQNSTDLTMWGAPGKYSVNVASAFATDPDGFNDMFNDVNVGNGSDMSYLIIEQVFQP